MPHPEFSLQKGVEQRREGMARSRVCQGRGAACAVCPAVWHAHTVTCLDSVAPQKLDHVLGEAWAKTGPEHAHVPWGPGANRPVGGLRSLSRRPSAPFSGAGTGGAEDAAPNRVPCAHAQGLS